MIRHNNVVTVPMHARAQVGELAVHGLSHPPFLIVGPIVLDTGQSVDGVGAVGNGIAARTGGLLRNGEVLPWQVGALAGR